MNIYMALRKLKRALQILLSYLNTLIPKKNQVLFYNESISDNNKYLMKYMANNTKLRILCYSSEKEIDSETIGIAKNRVEYTNNILKLFYYLARSKVMVTSFDHRYIIRPTKNQHYIQLWHGYALKNIGHDSKLGYWDKRGTYYTDILCYGELWKESICAAFGCKKDQLRIWDNPRNDLLYEGIEKSSVEAFLPGFNKMILWMPTYRKSKKLRDSSDSSRNIPILDSSNISALNNILAENGYVLVIKPHPLQNSLKETVTKQTNIVLLDNNDLKRNGIELYHFLTLADALITDYSSIYIDYLKLDRPICFAFDDFDEYKERRGFAFDEITHLMPGRIIGTADELCSFIQSLNNDDLQHEERSSIRTKLSFWNDNNNCKRISDYILSVIEA